MLAACGKAATELAGPLTAEAVVRIFERIIDEARRAERQEASAGTALSARVGRWRVRRRRDCREQAGFSRPRRGRHGCGDEGTRDARQQIDAVIARLIELGMDVHRSSGATRTVLGVVGANKIDPGLIGILDGVHEVLRISEPYKLASRTFKPEDTVVTVGDVRIGGDEVIVMAGPVLGRDRRAGRGRGGGGEARRRQDPARRRLQAAQLALQLPGARRAGPPDAARRRRSRTT